MTPEYLERISRDAARVGHLTTALSLLGVVILVCAANYQIATMYAPCAIATAVLFVLSGRNYGRAIELSLQADRLRLQHIKDRNKL
jgi:hypothetical protein